MIARRTLQWLFCLIAVLCQTSSSVAEEAIIRLDVFSTAKITAMHLLTDPRMMSDPSAILAEIETLKSRGEAEMVATPSLRGQLPFRAKSDGKVFVEVDASGSADTLYSLNIAVQTGSPKQISKILTGLQLKAGRPKFLGTLEPLAPNERERTWLVFIQAQ